MAPMAPPLARLCLVILSEQYLWLHECGEFVPICHSYTPPMCSWSTESMSQISYILHVAILTLI